MTPQESIVALCICREPNCQIPYGLCHCRCGSETTIAKSNNIPRGIIKGLPRKFKKGHFSKIVPIIEEAVPFKIDGVYCRLIPLDKGLYTIVWESDYLWLMQWPWYARWCKTTRSFYAARNSSVTEGKHSIIKMHRVIMDSPSKMNTDHRNHVTLDNRRDNLRLCDNSQNQCNRRISPSRKGEHKGVYWLEESRNWNVTIKHHGQIYRLGRYKDKDIAIEVRRIATQILHGDFAHFE